MDKLESLQKEFAFFNQDQTYFVNLINANPSLSIRGLRKKVIVEIRQSIYTDNYFWLIELCNNLSNVEQLINLLKLLENYNIYIDLDFLTNLLQKSKVLEQFLTDLFQGTSTLTTQEIKTKCPNDLLANFLNMYAILKNLIKEEELTVLSSYDFNLGDFSQELEAIPIMNQEEIIKNLKIIAKLKQNQLNFKEQDDAWQDIQKQIILIKNRIVEGNLHLVRQIARSFLNQDLKVNNILDLIQVGSMGLMKAVDKYDYSKGAQFSTYAAWWVKSYISKYIADFEKIIRQPVNFQEDYYKYFKKKNELINKLNRDPNLNELKEELNLSKKRLIQFEEAENLNTVSLDTPFKKNNNEELLLSTIIPDPNVNIEEEIINPKVSNELLNEILSSNLSFKNNLILHLYLGLAYPDQDVMTEYINNFAKIGRLLGLTREWVRRLYPIIIRSLRTAENLEKLNCPYEVTEEMQKSFKSYFGQYEKDLFIEAFKKLSQPEQQIIYKRFGESFNKRTKGISPLILSGAYPVILKLQLILANPTLEINNSEVNKEDEIAIQNNTLAAYLQISNEELQEFLNKPIFHNKKLSQLLRKAYGANLDQICQRQNLCQAERELLATYLLGWKKELDRDSLKLQRIPS